MNMQELLKKAKMSAEDLPQNLLDVESEINDMRDRIEDISLQLNHEVEGLTTRVSGDPEWVYKAQSARRIWRAKLNVFLRHAAELREAEAVARRRSEAELKAENAALGLQAAQIAKERAAINAEAQKAADTVVLNAVMKFANTLPDGLPRKFYEVAENARSEAESLQEVSA